MFRSSRAIYSSTKNVITADIIYLYRVPRVKYLESNFASHVRDHAYKYVLLIAHARAARVCTSVLVTSANYRKLDYAVHVVMPTQ